MVLAAARGVQTATPALDLLDVVSLTESEAHFENAKIVYAEKTKKPAYGRLQALAEIVPVVSHPAASAHAHRSHDRTQGQFDRLTVSHSPVSPQVGMPACPFA
jgi:hypothetical protein